MEGKNYIEAIKIAVRFSVEEGCDAERVLADSIVWLYYKYLAEKDSRFLRQSLKHMEAYFQLGYSYDIERGIFNKILELTGTDIKSLAVQNTQKGEIIKLNRSQIRRMIGKWNPHIHSMKINEVIDDIIDKVENDKDGTYCYFSGKRKENDGKVKPKNQYKLTVIKGQYEFFDISRKIYYTIKK